LITENHQIHEKLRELDGNRSKVVRRGKKEGNEDEMSENEMKQRTESLQGIFGKQRGEPEGKRENGGEENQGLQHGKKERGRQRREGRKKGRERKRERQ